MEAAIAVLTVMTFNVNFGLGGDASTLAAIEKGRADVVFLQETTPRWEKAIRKRLADTYPHIAFNHCCRAGGMAVLSKHPFEPGEVIAAPTRWFPAWRVVVHAPLGDVQVLNVHLRPPVSDSGSWIKGYFTTAGYRARELKHYLERLDEKLPTLVLGDFNETRGPALDMLWARGMRSALHEADPDATTWRWPSPIGQLTQALDHVFYGPGLDALRARVVKAGRSDRMPVVVQLQKR